MAVVLTDLGTVAVKSGTKATITTTVAIPAGAVVFVMMAFSDTGGTNVTVGGTPASSQFAFRGNTTSQFSVAGYWVPAPSGYPAGTDITSTKATNLTTLISAFYATGADTYFPVDLATVAGTNSTGANTTPSVVIAATPIAGTVVVGAMQADGINTETFTPPGGWSAAPPPTRIGTGGGGIDITMSFSTITASFLVTFAPTLGTARNWSAIIFGIRPAGTYTYSLGTSTGKAVTTAPLTITQAIPAGAMVVVCYAGTVGFTTISVPGVSLTLINNPSGNGAFSGILYGVTASQINSGTVISVQSTTSGALNASAFMITGVDPTTREDTACRANATGSSAAPSLQMGAIPAVANSIVVMNLAVNGPIGDTFTQFGSWTAPPDRVGTTGGSATSNATGGGGKNVTSTRITYSPTLGTSRGWVLNSATFRPAPSGPPTGTLALTQDNQTISAQANSVVNGDLARTQANQTLASVGTVAGQAAHKLVLSYQASGGYRADWTGALGVQFTAAIDMLFNKLGLRCGPDHGVQTVYLWNFDDPTTPLRSVAIDLTGKDEGTFYYGDVTPITLTAGQRYFLGAEAVAGGARWDENAGNNSSILRDSINVLGAYTAPINTGINPGGPNSMWYGVDMDNIVPATATLVITQANQTIGGVGRVLVGGTLAATQVNQTLGGIGRVAVGGTLGQLQADQTLAATGGPVARGTLGVQQDPQTLLANGVVVVGGTLNQTQASQTLVGAGKSDIVGGLGLQQDPQTLAATGAVFSGVNGNLILTQDSQTLGAAGEVRGFIGTLELTQDEQRLVAAGVVASQGTQTRIIMMA